MKLRRRIRINAQGNELYKFINGIHGEGLVCLGQYVRYGVLYGEVSARDLKKLRELADRYDVELKEAEYVTLMSVLWRYRKRVGIILGIALAVLCCTRFSQTVTDIEIQGNSAVSDEAIMSVLEQLDVKQGAHIRDIDMHFCEHELQIRMKDIAWAAMRRTGSRIVVQVTEVTPKPEMLMERVPCNIVAAKDAEITGVNVLDGMLMHKIGDHVPQGTLLISGIAEDDTGHVTVHHAYGYITGKYTETAEFREELHPSRYVPTGRKDKERYLRVLNVDIPLFIGRNKYTSSDVEAVEKPLSLFGKEMPLSIITRTLSETALTSEEVTEEEADRRIMEKMYLYEKNFLGDCKLIKRDIKREKIEDAIVFKAEYKLEGEIGRQKEIYVK